jgi:holo-[acyl-carrier protein] synthase
MIFGIGTDIVQISRIQENIDRYGERFVRRVLTHDELDEYRRTIHPAHFVARRFAVKEAVAKAFGTGFTSGLTLRHIGVGHDARGRPLLKLNDRARELCRELGVGDGHVSVADEREYAVAFVTLMRAHSTPDGGLQQVVEKVSVE